KDTFKITLKVPIKNGWKYTIQATKRGLAAKNTLLRLYTPLQKQIKLKVIIIKMKFTTCRI
ncbi:hypothetical protein LG101_13270, partial [Levilactobacillus brevis]